jgi:hypothetical protein
VRRIRLDHQPHDLAALVAQLRDQRLLVVTGKPGHDLLEMHGDIERLFLDWQVFIAHMENPLSLRSQ